MTARGEDQSGSGAHTIFPKTVAYTHAIASNFRSIDPGTLCPPLGVLYRRFHRTVSAPGFAGKWADYENCSASAAMDRFVWPPVNQRGASSVNVTNSDQRRSAGKKPHRLRIYPCPANNIISRRTIRCWQPGTTTPTSRRCKNPHVQHPGTRDPGRTAPGTYWLGAVLDSSTDMANSSNNNVWAGMLRKNRSCQHRCVRGPLRELSSNRDFQLTSLLKGARRRNRLGPWAGRCAIVIIGGACPLEPTAMSRLISLLSANLILGLALHAGRFCVGIRRRLVPEQGHRAVQTAMLSLSTSLVPVASCGGYQNVQCQAWAGPCR